MILYHRDGVAAKQKNCKLWNQADGFRWDSVESVPLNIKMSERVKVQQGMSWKVFDVVAVQVSVERRREDDDWTERESIRTFRSETCSRFNEMLPKSRVTRPNLGPILRLTYYSVRLGLVPSPKVNRKLARVW